MSETGSLVHGTGSESDSQVSDDKGPSIRWLIGAAVAIIVLQVLYALVIIFWFNNLDMAARGQFGDLFGAVNALFTGLAFAALIYTVILQRNELGLQREELRLSREELRRSVEAQRGSEQALAEQVELSVITTLVDNYTRQLDSLHTQTDVGYSASRLQEIDEHLASHDLSAGDRTSWTEERQRTVSQGGTALKPYLELQQKRKDLLIILEQKFSEEVAGNATQIIERHS